MKADCESNTNSENLLFNKLSPETKSNDEIDRKFSSNIGNEIQNNNQIRVITNIQEPLNILVEIDKEHEATIQIFPNREYISTIKNFCKIHSISKDKEEFLILAINTQIQKILKLNEIGSIPEEEIESVEEKTLNQLSISIS